MVSVCFVAALTPHKLQDGLWEELSREDGGEGHLREGDGVQIRSSLRGNPTLPPPRASGRVQSLIVAISLSLRFLE